MLQSFPAALRILNTVSTMLGAQDSLAGINTAIVMDRALVTCVESGLTYQLHKDSVEAQSLPDIVAPVAGLGRWVATAAASGVVRCDWALDQRETSASYTFAPGSGPVYNISTEAGVLAGINTDDTIFFQPVECLLGFFHSADPAPQFGGVWLVVDKIDDQNMTVRRVAELSTSAQIDATALICADAGTGAGVYQVVTPAGAAIDVDPQVMPWVARQPPPIDNNTYKLQVINGQLFWTLDPP
jgi:hypothetical protein